MKKQVVIVGGGAAGFFCAANIDERLYNVTILEKQSKVLQKVKVSGGGRCNVTHDCNEQAEMIKAYPRGSKPLRQAFSHFFTTDTKSWFRDRGVKLKTENDGRMFPVSDNSGDIIYVLENEVGKKGFKVWNNVAVKDIEKSNDRFTIILDNGNELFADFVLIATGGFNKPEHYDWIRKFGHKIIPPVPSLFTFNVPDKTIHELKGNSVEHAEVKIQGLNYVSSGPVLFTHWGFSGPAILKLSSYMAKELSEKNYDFEFLVNWIPSLKQDALRNNLEHASSANPEKKVVNFSPFSFTSSFWNYILQRSSVDSELKWKELKGKKRNLLVERLSNDRYHAIGKTTFKEEFVTCGGVDLKEVDFKSMESKIQPGLFFAGEILDIDGITGGYNFQAAWTTGYIAASYLNSKN